MHQQKFMATIFEGFNEPSLFEYAYEQILQPLACGKQNAFTRFMLSDLLSCEIDPSRLPESYFQFLDDSLQVQDRITASAVEVTHIHTRHVSPPVVTAAAFFYLPTKQPLDDRMWGNRKGQHPKLGEAVKFFWSINLEGIQNLITGFPNMDDPCRLYLCSRDITFYPILE